MVKLKNFSKIFEDDKLLTLTLILWEGGQLPNPNECNSDTNADECNSTLTSAKRGETLTTNPNECNSTVTSAILILTQTSAILIIYSGNG